MAVAIGCGGKPPDSPGVDAAIRDASPDGNLEESPDAGAGPPVLGGGAKCDLYAIARGIAEEHNDVPPVDCGVAVLTDPQSTWVSLSRCLEESLQSQKAFFGAYQLDNSVEPDSIRALAFVGIAGPPFVLKEVHWDSDPAGGAGLPPRAVLHECVDDGLRESCTPGPGWVCMGCFDQKRPDLADLCPGWPRSGP